MGFNKAHKMAQRLHRERRQPEYRKKFGYLEKKQDYKKRAIDHHTKADRLRKLKNKALERNPNEFALHMINSRIVDGVHQDLVKPIPSDIRQKIVRKEELLKRYNEQVLRQRKSRKNPRNMPEGNLQLTQPSTSKSKVPKHIIFHHK